MITDYRPLPKVEYEVAWNGAIDRVAQRAQQRRPPENDLRGREAREFMRGVLQVRPGKVWTLAQLAEQTGFSLSYVGVIIAQMRRDGLVLGEVVSMSKSSAGKQLRVWVVG